MKQTYIIAEAGVNAVPRAVDSIFGNAIVVGALQWLDADWCCGTPASSGARKKISTARRWNRDTRKV